MTLDEECRLFLFSFHLLFDEYHILGRRDHRRTYIVVLVPFTARRRRFAVGVLGTQAPAPAAGRTIAASIAPPRVYQSATRPPCSRRSPSACVLRRRRAGRGTAR